jgi:hypothetical protein
MKAGLVCLLGLLAVAGCGRVGYEQIQLAELPVDAAPDAERSWEAGTDAPPDLPGPDAPPDVADAPLDVPPDAPPDVPSDVPPDQVVTATYGQQTGTLYTDLCPPDHVLAGLQGSAGPSSGTIYDNLAGICALVNVSPSPPYRVTWTSSRLLPARGTGEVEFAIACEANQAVVGFEGRAGPDLRALTFVCADLTATGGPPSHTVVPGSVRYVQPLMNVAGGTPFSAACPPGQLARGTHLWAGPKIQAFGLACGTVSVRP